MTSEGYEGEKKNFFLNFLQELLFGNKQAITI